MCPFGLSVCIRLVPEVRLAVSIDNMLISSSLHHQGLTWWWETLVEDNDIYLSNTTTVMQTTCHSSGDLVATIFIVFSLVYNGRILPTTANLLSIITLVMDIGISGAPSGGWESRRIINHIYSNILLNSITKYVKPFYPSSHNRKFDRNYIPFVYFTKKTTLTFHRSQPGFQAVCSTSPMVLQSSRVQHRDTV